MSAIIGLSWYEPDDYHQLRNSLTDAEHFPLEYEAWLADVESSLRYFKSNGYRVLQLPVKPPEFITFCRRRGISPDCAAHKTFVSDKLSRQLPSSVAPSGCCCIDPPSRYNEAVQIIDSLFGPGHCAKDPDLLSAYLQAQAQKNLQSAERSPWFSSPGNQSHS